MTFIEVTADEQNIYGVTGGGSLVWYRDTARNGTNAPDGSTGWAAASGSQIGQGWDVFKHVFAGGGGILYAIRDSGELVWYKDALRNGTNGPTGSTGWAAGSGNQIGSGWQIFSQVVYGGDGIIYAIKATGELYWYRDLARNGTPSWAANSGHQIGAGWNNFRVVFSGGSGVLYAITPAGTLHWYKDTLRNGTNATNGSTGWAAGSGNQIGTGWQDFPAVIAPGAADGIIYATTTSGDLRWYQDTVRNGTNGATGGTGWATNSGAIINHGWSISPRTLTTGYVKPLSVAPGGSVDLKLSALTATSGMLQVVRLRENTDGSVGVPVGTANVVTLPHQAVPALSFQNGCGWTTSATVTVDPAWQSGLYSARVATSDGRVTDLVFVVRPGATRKDLLLVANTDTWNAYNAWGGASNYSGYADVVTLSFDRPNPETVPRANLQGVYQSNHLTAGEIWFATWLEDAGYQFDVCSDYDVHLGNPGFTGYKGVVMSTHPEYWSVEMAQRLKDYVAAGGRVLYLGGNGIFRRVTFAADGSTMTTGSKPPDYTANAWGQGPDTRTLLGVGYDITRDLNYPQRCPYVIDLPNHPFLAGTALTQGALVGAQGRNGGGACGWEVDCAVDSGDGNGPPPANLQIIAHGQLTTAQGYTGHMTYYNNAAGGFVFSMGSITAGGSVPVDATLAKIVRNALDACLAP